MKKITLLYFLIGIIGVASIAFGINDYFSKNNDLEKNTNITTLSLNISTPIAESGMLLEEEDDANSLVIRDIIYSGETAGVLLRNWLDNNEVYSFINSCKDVFDLGKLKINSPYIVLTNSDGSLVEFEYEIDNAQKLVVKRSDSGFIASLEQIKYDIKLEKISGIIESSLSLAISELGEKNSLATKLSDIFAWEINFIKDIQSGDSFTLLVEKRFREGKFKGYGKLLAAEFSNRGKVYDAYLYKMEYGDQYYTSNGESLRREFLKAPLNYTRISSPFSTSRLHPIFKTWRPHPAVDYAAPTGTPVKAVADGSVIFVGSGQGEGNYIKLTHNNGYETAYLHLSKFASGIKKGNSVIQGQVIGYVGSTGHATGPHLDFRMKKNGTYVNPETALSPRSVPLSKSDRILFAQQRDIIRNYFDNESAVAAYEKEKLGVTIE